jgi:hypothetical protein
MQNNSGFKELHLLGYSIALPAEKSSDVSEKYVASIFKVEEYAQHESGWEADLCCLLVQLII